MSMKTYVGTIEKQDLGAGQYLLHSLDGKSTTYRLVFDYTEHDLYEKLNTHSIAGDITTLRAQEPEGGVQVVGGTSLPVLTVQSAE